MGNLSVEVCIRLEERLEAMLEKVIGDLKQTVEVVSVVPAKEEKKVEVVKPEPIREKSVPQESTEEAETYTLSDVRTALSELAEKKGKATAKQVLKELDCKSVSLLDESLYATAMILIKELME